MMKLNSKLGWILSTIYAALCILLILMQGLTGESFIALILGLPWSLALAYFEYFHLGDSAWLYVLLIAPLVINAKLLYCLGAWLEGRIKGGKRS